MPPTRTSYGVEAEFFGIRSDDAVEVLNGAGITAQDDGYHHESRRYWRITEDGSVNGTGLELVSPVLSRTTMTHTRAVTKAAKALREAGAVVDTSCGLHVHHSITGKDVEDVAQAAGLYTMFQRVIDTVLPPSRVGAGASGYCRPMTAADGPTGWLANIRSYDFTDLMRNGCWNFGRYHGINLQALAAHGTLEFRQHSGTLNGEKINRWTTFTRLFMDANERGKTVEGVNDEVQEECGTIAGLIRWLEGSDDLAEFYTKRAELFATRDEPDDEDVSRGGTRFVTEEEEDDEYHDDDTSWCDACGEYH